MPALGAAMLLLVAAGCGGDEPAESADSTTTSAAGEAEVAQDDPAATLEAFLRALIAGDAAAACDMLSEHGVMLVEEGALQSSPSGGGPCREVVIDSYGSPDASVVDGLRVVETTHSTDGTLRLVWVNADTPITRAVAARLSREGGQYRIDSTGIPAG